VLSLLAMTVPAASTSSTWAQFSLRCQDAASAGIDGHGDGLPCAGKERPFVQLPATEIAPGVGSPSSIGPLSGICVIEPPTMVPPICAARV
jgi:hypothetical protein